jgi:hypothetical protein
MAELLIEMATTKVHSIAQHSNSNIIRGTLRKAVTPDWVKVQRQMINLSTFHYHSVQCLLLRLSVSHNSLFNCPPTLRTSGSIRRLKVYNIIPINSDEFHDLKMSSTEP